MNEKILFADKESGELIVPNQRAVRTQYNGHLFPSYHEENTLPSLTVPDQTMSIADLMERHKRGLPIAGNNLHPVYHGEEEMPDLRRMDLSEIQALKEYNEQIIFEENEKLQQAETKRKKKEQDDYFEAELEKRMNLKNKKNEKPGTNESLPI